MILMRSRRCVSIISAVSNVLSANFLTTRSDHKIGQRSRCEHHDRPHHRNLNGQTMPPRHSSRGFQAAHNWLYRKRSEIPVCGAFVFRTPKESLSDLRSPIASSSIFIRKKHTLFGTFGFKIFRRSLSTLRNFITAVFDFRIPKEVHLPPTAPVCPLFIIQGEEWLTLFGVIWRQILPPPGKGGPFVVRSHVLLDSCI